MDELVTFKLQLPTGSTAPMGGNLFLENSLTDPVMAGTVTGAVLVTQPPTWSGLSSGWAEPGQKVTITGRSLKLNTMPTVSVGGMPAQVLSANSQTVDFRMPAAVTAGPIVLTNEAGSVTLSGSFPDPGGQPHPGFFVVSGPTAITALVPPTSGDTVVVKGQNLARAAGICVMRPGQTTAQQLLRTPRTNFHFATSNTEMLVPYATGIPSGSIVQPLVPQTPNGDFLSSDYACSSTGASTWP
jgi:hypothetical protein